MRFLNFFCFSWKGEKSFISCPPVKVRHSRPESLCRHLLPSNAEQAPHGQGCRFDRAKSSDREKACSPSRLSVAGRPTHAPASGHGSFLLQGYCLSERRGLNPLCLQSGNNKVLTPAKEDDGSQSDDKLEDRPQPLTPKIEWKVSNRKGSLCSRPGTEDLLEFLHGLPEIFPFPLLKGVFCLLENVSGLRQSLDLRRSR